MTNDYTITDKDVLKKAIQLFKKEKFLASVKEGPLLKYIKAIAV
jgi:hypothetical protein